MSHGYPTGQNIRVSIELTTQIKENWNSSVAMHLFIEVATYFRVTSPKKYTSLFDDVLKLATRVLESWLLDMEELEKTDQGTATLSFHPPPDPHRQYLAVAWSHFEVLLPVVNGNTLPFS